jgi:hypothetical protein
MQSYPGGIESGTDWYQNDAGVVLTETTIRQTPFNAQGTPVAFRARIAIQYGGNIDEVVERLGARNNGLYTNEWLLGDAKNNEIAMYELGLCALQSGDLAKALDARRATWRRLKLEPDDDANRFRLEETKGVLFLDSLRRKLGDDRFFALMAEFFTANAGATVTAQSFLEKAGVPFEFPEPEDGPAYLLTDIYRHLSGAILVYGTGREAGANRYAAEQIQSDLLDDYESAVPIYKDFEVSDELLRHRDVARFRARGAPVGGQKPIRRRAHGPGGSRQQRAPHREGLERRVNPSRPRHPRGR